MKTIEQIKVNWQCHNQKNGMSWNEIAELVNEVSAQPASEQGEECPTCKELRKVCSELANAPTPDAIKKMSDFSNFDMDEPYMATTPQPEPTDFREKGKKIETGIDEENVSPTITHYRPYIILHNRKNKKIYLGLWFVRKMAEEDIVNFKKAISSLIPDVTEDDVRKIIEDYNSPLSIRSREEYITWRNGLAKAIFDLFRKEGRNV